MLNQGKCHYCHEPIKGRHIIVELTGGILFLGAYLVFGFFAWEFFVSCVLITVLIAEAMADIEEGIVIDRIWMGGLILLAGVRIIQQDFFPYLWSSLGLFGVMLGLLLLGKFLFKKDALGGGDVKLYLFIGFALTFSEGLLSIFLAALFGLIYALTQKKHFGHPLRFVPAIALAAVICHWFAADAIAWYLALLGV
jgi:prepilin signal peptidase PulO-like enzyme (type II secretory pathway)